MGSATLHEEDGSIIIAWDFDGEFIVSVEVAAFGFTGHSDGHVDTKNFNSFRRSLAILEKNRRGGAVLSSVYPGLFEITVQSTDDLGHMAVGGALRFDANRKDTHIQELHFEFEFEPSKLRSFVRAFDDDQSI